MLPWFLQVKQAPDAPELPPRDVSPPPIPPRINTNTLPRMYSSGGGSHFHHSHPHPPPAPHSHTLHHPHHPHPPAPYHRAPPASFLTASVPPAPPLQPHYPPQDSPHHRRNNSVDLTSPTPLARRHTNGPHTGQCTVLSTIHFAYTVLSLFLTDVMLPDDILKVTKPYKYAAQLILYSLADVGSINSL